MNNKILILGAGEGQLPLISRAKNTGWYVIVASPEGNYPGFTLADECFYVDVSNEKLVLDYAERSDIKAIASDQTDISMSTVQYVAKRLGLPCINCDEIDYFRYKSKMRQVCLEYGLRTISYCETSNVDDAIAFFNSLSLRQTIIKPVDSQGSRGVTRIDDLDSLPQAFDLAMKYSKSKQVIIEQFIEGQEIEVDTVVYQNEIMGVLIGDVKNFVTANKYSAYERIYPSKLPLDIQNYICEINAKTISALGLHTGWTHGEYIVSKSGDVYLLEIGARGGGNYIGSDIVKTMLGRGTDEMALNTALGDLSFYKDVYLRNSYCAYKCFLLPEGEIESINIDWSYLNQPFVLKHNLLGLQVGLKISKSTDKTSRFTIVVKAKNHNELRQILDDIPNHINIVVKNKLGTRPIIWK